MHKRILMTAAVALAVALPGQAADRDREFADIYTECGLGAIIAPRNAAVAAVTNVTWDSGTTAISSHATTPESCQGGQASAAAFILDAYPSLEQDLARGDGEHLVALMRIAGCDASVHPELAMALRAGFSGVVEDAGYSERSDYEHAETLYDLLNEKVGAGFASSCAIG